MTRNCQQHVLNLREKMVLCVALIGLLIYAERPIFTSAALDEPKCVIFCVFMKLWDTKDGRKLSSKENKRTTS